MKLISKIKNLVFIFRNKRRWKGSASYWENRYRSGGTSGAGSYNELARFKARILNNFVKERGIASVIEWGCGDGNQLSLSEYPRYIGYDVSQKAIEICKEKFKTDATKTFVWCGSQYFMNEKRADLSLSLDVIYHLIEDEVYEKYMHNLFLSAKKYIIIYACDTEKYHNGSHVRSRIFSEWIKFNYPSWKLITVIKNDYPYNPQLPNDTSWSDFYIYENV